MVWLSSTCQGLTASVGIGVEQAEPRDTSVTDSLRSRLSHILHQPSPSRESGPLSLLPAGRDESRLLATLNLLKLQPSAAK